MNRLGLKFSGLILTCNVFMSCVINDPRFSIAESRLLCESRLSTSGVAFPVRELLRVDGTESLKGVSFSCPKSFSAAGAKLVFDLDYCLYPLVDFGSNEIYAESLNSRYLFVSDVTGEAKKLEIGTFDILVLDSTSTERGLFRICVPLFLRVWSEPRFGKKKLPKPFGRVERPHRYLGDTWTRVLSPSL
jgi:hypothetical protein